MTMEADDALAQGKALLAQGDFSAALAWFEHIAQEREHLLRPVSDDATNPRPWAGATLEEMRAADEPLYREAVEASERVMTQFSHFVTAWEAEGYSREFQLRSKVELTFSSRENTRRADAAMAQFFKGYTLHLLGRDEEAVTAYQRAIRLYHPNVGLFFYHQAVALEALYRYDYARLALEFAPDDKATWEARARVLRALGRVAEAEEAERGAHPAEE